MMINNNLSTASTIIPKRRKPIFNTNTPFADRPPDSAERTVFYGKKPDGSPHTVSFLLLGVWVRDVKKNKDDCVFNNGWHRG